MIEDVSHAYRAWSEVFEFGLRMALSTEHGTPEERREAIERLRRGMELEDLERERAWERMSLVLAGQYGR